LGDDSCDESVRIAQAEFDRRRRESASHLPKAALTATLFHRRAAFLQVITIGDATMAEGTIKKLMSKGFGFIDTGTGEEIFFHSSNLEGVSFDALREGQNVSYTVGQSSKGPRAEDVTSV
jgi:CspA family cold shock protein